MPGKLVAQIEKEHITAETKLLESWSSLLS
jgi:hypothetical protein